MIPDRAEIILTIRITHGARFQSCTVLRLNIFVLVFLFCQSTDRVLKVKQPWQNDLTLRPSALLLSARDRPSLSSLQTTFPSQPSSDLPSQPSDGGLQRMTFESASARLVEMSSSQISRFTLGLYWHFLDVRWISSRQPAIIQDLVVKYHKLEIYFTDKETEILGQQLVAISGVVGLHSKEPE